MFRIRSPSTARAERLALAAAGLSQTTNPPGPEAFMRDLVAAAGAEMAKEGVIAPLKTGG